MSEMPQPKNTPPRIVDAAPTVTPKRFAEAEKKVTENRAMLDRNFEPEEVGKLLGAYTIASKAAQLVHRPDNRPPRYGIGEKEEIDYRYNLFTDYVSQEFNIADTSVLNGIHNVTEEYISEQKVVDAYNKQQQGN